MTTVFETPQIPNPTPEMQSLAMQLIKAMDRNIDYYINRRGKVVQMKKGIRLDDEEYMNSAEKLRKLMIPTTTEDLRKIFARILDGGSRSLFAKSTVGYMLPKDVVDGMLDAREKLRSMFQVETPKRLNLFEEMNLEEILFSEPLEVEKTETPKRINPFFTAAQRELMHPTSEEGKKMQYYNIVKTNMMSFMHSMQRNYKSYQSNPKEGYNIRYDVNEWPSFSRLVREMIPLLEKYSPEDLQQAKESANKCQEIYDKYVQTNDFKICFPDHIEMRAEDKIAF